MRSFPPPWTLRRSGGIVTISVIGNPQPLAVGMIEHALFREYCYNNKVSEKGRVKLVFQGNLSEELTALLTRDETLTSHGGVKGSEYNLPKSVINISLRKGVPV
jgi:hypothetical protein